jgi:RimJ/RimL family protein N-acetyltransferase
MTVLYGLLVDLEPITSEFYEERMHEFWNNESRLWATMGEDTPTTRAQIKRQVEEWAQGRERGDTGVHFMLRAKDGTVIGSIGLNWINEWHRFAWVGAWIGDPAYWSGGHGSDALLLITEYAFQWLDLRRLVLGTMDLNARAQRNVEKCGFRLEARHRSETFVHGKPVDGLLYGLLRREWPGRAALVEELDLPVKAAQRYGVEE